MNGPDFTTMTRREIEDYLVELSMVEPGFRERLLKEPAVVLRELGLPVGDDVHIEILEEKPKSFYLVLPRVLKEVEEMEESELDAIEGGLSSQGAVFKFFRGYH
jgi:hypothetical protein